MSEDRERIRERLKTSIESFKKMSSAVKADKEIVIEVLKVKGSMLSYVDPRIQNDKDVVLAAVSQNGNMLNSCYKHYLDKDVVLAALRQTKCVGPHITTELYKDRQFCLDVIKAGYTRFVCEFKENIDFVMEAVKLNGLYVEMLSWEYKLDREVALAAVSQNGLALEYLRRFTGDVKIVRCALRQTGRAIPFVSRHFLDDEDIIFEAALSYAGTLRDASERLRDNKKIVLAALSNTDRSEACSFAGIPFEYISSRLKDDEDVVRLELSISPVSFKYISDRLKKDLSIILSGKFLEYLPANKDIYMEVIRRYSDQYLLIPKYSVLVNDKELQQYETKKGVCVRQMGRRTIRSIVCDIRILIL